MNAPLRTTLLCLAMAPCAAPAQSRLYTIHSKVLGEDRAIRVSLPPNYALARRRYQVTYLLDGHLKAFFDLTVAAAGYDLVGDVHDYATPPQIVVGVQQIDRGADLGRNQEAFDRFLVEEVVPFVEREFRAARFRTLIGHSLGGRFALNTFCRNPGVFPAVIAISPGIGDSTGFAAVADCLRKDFAANHSVVRQLVITAGDREARLSAAAVRLRDFLRESAPPNWRWTFVDGTGLGHTETPYAAIPAGIRFVHDKSVWEMPTARADSVRQGKLDPDRSISDWYASLSARMGYTVAPSVKWLMTAASVHLARRELPAAEAAAKRFLAEYPEDLSAYGYLADVYLASDAVPATRRTLSDALRMADRLEFFDETERTLRKKLLRENLDKLPP